MGIKVKDSGSFKDVDQVHVKDSGAWKKSKIVHVKDSGVWKISHESLVTYTFTKGDAPATDGAYGVYTDVNLDQYFDAADKFWNCKAVINSDVVFIASSTSTYALNTGSGYGGTLTIENNGSIVGRGGNGGKGGNAYAS